MWFTAAQHYLRSFFVLGTSEDNYDRATRTQTRETEELLVILVAGIPEDCGEETKSKKKATNAQPVSDHLREFHPGYCELAETGLRSWVKMRHHHQKDDLRVRGIMTSEFPDEHILSTRKMKMFTD